MKKIIAALLTLIMVASLCACASDHTLKYNGVWTDGTTNSVLELREDGTAALRLGSELYDFIWTAEDYDTVVLSVEVPTNEEPQFAPVIEDETPAEDEAEVDETPAEDEAAPAEDEAAPAEDEAEVDETPAEDNTLEEEIPADDETTDTTEAPTFNIRTKNVVLFKLTLSIRQGIMYLVVDEVNKDGIYYYDFSHLMEGIVVNNIEYEYFPELSKRFKSIAFTKKA